MANDKVNNNTLSISYDEVIAEMNAPSEDTIAVAEIISATPAVSKNNPSTLMIVLELKIEERENLIKCWVMVTGNGAKGDTGVQHLVLATKVKVTNDLLGATLNNDGSWSLESTELPIVPLIGKEIKVLISRRKVADQSGDDSMSSMMEGVRKIRPVG